MGITILILVALGTGIWIGYLIGFSKAMREAAGRLVAKAATSKPVRAWAFIAVSMTCLVLAVGFAIHTAFFLRVATRTNGRVVELRERRDKDNRTTYFPVVSFHDAGGAEHLIESHTSTFPAGDHIGETLPVLYSNRNPEDAAIDQFMEIWGAAIISGVLGFIGLVAGFGELFWRRSRGHSCYPLKQVPAR
jgi:hypothetical protein